MALQQLLADLNYSHGPHGGLPALTCLGLVNYGAAAAGFAVSYVPRCSRPWARTWASPWLFLVFLGPVFQAKLDMVLVYSIFLILSTLIVHDPPYVQGVKSFQTLSYYEIGFFVTSLSHSLHACAVTFRKVYGPH
jgi:hypothetical protein